jgi:hypothetical protein
LALALLSRGPTPHKTTKIEKWHNFNNLFVTFNFNFLNFPTGAGAPQLCRRARTPRKRAFTTLGAF